MGKVYRLRNRVEPFAALFWALGNVLANTWPWQPALHHSTAVHKACPYMVIVGSILIKTRPAPPLFLSRYVIYLCVDVSKNALISILKLPSLHPPGIISASFFKNIQVFKTSSFRRLRTWAQVSCFSTRIYRAGVFSPQQMGSNLINAI